MRGEKSTTLCDTLDITVNVTVALFNWKEHNATQTTKQWGNIHDYKGRKKTQCNPVKQDKGGNTK